MAGQVFDTADGMPGEAAEGAVHQALARYNTRRAAVARRMLFRLMVVIVPVVIAVVVAVGIILTSGPGLAVYGLIVFGFALFCWGGTLAVLPSRRFQRGFRAELLPAVFGFVDEFSYHFRMDPAFPGVLIDNFVQGLNSKHFYMLSGVHRDMPFTLTETEFSDNKEGGEGTLFRGIVLQFTLADLFPGMLLVLPQDFSTRRPKRHFLEHRKLISTRSGNRQVDHSFAFRTDALDATTSLLAGEFPEALLCVGQTWPGGVVQLLLSGNKGFLLLTGRKNVFELPGIDQSITYDATLQPMIRDLQSLLTAANLIRSTAVFRQEVLS